jgi:hypothetical protein
MYQPMIKRSSWLLKTQVSNTHVDLVGRRMSAMQRTAATTTRRQVWVSLNSDRGADALSERGCRPTTLASAGHTAAAAIDAASADDEGFTRLLPRF